MEEGINTGQDKGTIKVQIPSSSKYSARALVIAALCEDDVFLENVSKSKDTQEMIAALGSLGVSFAKEDSRLRVQGSLLGAIKEPKVERVQLHVGDSGTAMRFLSAACVVGQDVIIDGSKRMRERPIGHLIEALTSLVQGELTCDAGYPPVQFRGVNFLGGSTRLNGSVSSQFLSGLLMVAPCAKEKVVINIEGGLVSRTYVDMTLSIMKEFGVAVENENYECFTVLPQKYGRTSPYTIEGDATGAMYFAGAGAILGERVDISGIPKKSVQGDLQFLSVLENMGCIMQWDENSFSVQGPSTLSGVSVNLDKLPDSAQTLAVLASVAEGETHISGIGNLRVKETDRITALETELTKLGIRVESGEDWLRIHGGNPGSGSIETYNDHRMAMSFSLLTLVRDGINILNPGCVEKSFPEFFDLFESIQSRD